MTVGTLAPAAPAGSPYRRSVLRPGQKDRQPELVVILRPIKLPSVTAIIKPDLDIFLGWPNASASPYDIPAVVGGCVLLPRIYAQHLVASCIVFESACGKHLSQKLTALDNLSGLFIFVERVLGHAKVDGAH